jgi:hypothetical protein
LVGLTSVLANGIDQIREGFLAFLKSFSDCILDHPPFHIDRPLAGCRCLVHFGPDKTQTWLLVRLKQPEMLNAPQTAEAETKGS